MNGSRNRAQLWSRENPETGMEKLLDYISSNGAVAVTLSDYNREYHGWTWVRDGALIMREVARRMAMSPVPEKRQRLNQLMLSYMTFSRRTQDTMDEPRFDHQGKPYKGPWGRPQNDGPALRALTLLDALSFLELTDAQLDFVHQIILADLDYTVETHGDKSFDIWEEKNGFHFYTLLMQSSALRRGESFVRALGDASRATLYKAASDKLESRLLHEFWDDARKTLVASLETDPWRHTKNSNIDIAAILAIVHAGRSPDEAFSVSDDRSRATALLIERTFRPLYAINRIAADRYGDPIAPAIGRYPEDVYNGHPNESVRFTEAHPWVLATYAMSEFYFKHAEQLSRRSSLTINDTNVEFFRSLVDGVPGQNRIQELPSGRTIAAAEPLFRDLIVASFKKGLAFQRRIHFHFPRLEYLPEMIHRDTGRVQSIPSLAWSNASELSVLAAKESAERQLRASGIQTDGGQGLQGPLPGGPPPPNSGS